MMKLEDVATLALHAIISAAASRIPDSSLEPVTTFYPAPEHAAQQAVKYAQCLIKEVELAKQPLGE